MYIFQLTSYTCLYTDVLKAYPESNWKEENQMSSCEQRLAFRVYKCLL